MTRDDRPAPRIWAYLLGAAAVGVVALSWMAPEPQSPRPTPPQRYESISYSGCAAQDFAPPSYGTRSVSSTSPSDAVAAGPTDCIR